MDHIKYIFKKLYYQLTCYVPRRLPKTQDEFVNLQEILEDYYDVEDREDIWLTLCGQISSTHSTKMKRSYKGLANACQRLDVNRTVQEIKGVYIRQLENKLKEATERVINEPKQEEPCTDEVTTSLPIGSLDLLRDLSVM